MLPAQIADQELARMVKENHSNEAMTEILDRHTGVYFSVINGFNLPPMIKNDLIDQKNTNIYSYTLGYKDDRNMALPSYIWQSARYECLKALGKDKVKFNEELDENAFSESFTYNDEESVKQTSLTIARQVGGHEFARIVEARHFGDETAKLSWHHVGPKLGKSYEWARKLYYLHIDEFSDKISRKFNYVSV